MSCYDEEDNVSKQNSVLTWAYYSIRLFYKKKSGSHMLSIVSVMWREENITCVLIIYLMYR